MGVGTSAPPINEGVSLLNKLAPDLLGDLRHSFGVLGEELKLGRLGGETQSDEALNKLRAMIIVKALEAAKERAETELELLRVRISSAKKFRLGSQLAALICSSGVLGAIALGDKNVTVATAILSVIASFGVIIAEYKEKLLKQGDGDVYAAFESAGQAAYKAGLLKENLGLLSTHAPDSDDLRQAITEGNAICYELNGWLIKISGSRG